MIFHNGSALAPGWDLAPVKRQRAKSYPLESSLKPSAGGAEEKEATHINGIVSMPVCGMQLYRTEHSEPDKALNQKGQIHYVSVGISTAAPSAVIFREFNREEN